MSPSRTTSRSRGSRQSGSRRTAAALLLIAAGLALALYPTWTDLYYRWSQWRLADEAAKLVAAALAEAGRQAGTPASGPGGVPGTPLPEGAVAHIEIPAIGVRAYVIEGTGRSVLAAGPGHYPGTPLPGEPGNAAIAGHRTMHGHVFGDLDRLRPGDEILTATAGGTASYRVVRVTTVEPDRVDVLRPTSDDRLTLTTCHPKGSAAQRLVVVAERID